MARNVRFELRRGAGSSLEVLYGRVSLRPTMMHNVASSVVLPAITTFDLVNGIAIATNVAPSPDPVDGMVEWAYLVKVEDNHCKTFEFLVGVPEGTSEINFNELPRYFETKPPLFGRGPQGVPGEAATIAIGTTTSGTTPAVTNSGTSTDAVLNFTLAQGPAGPTGAGVPAGGAALQVVRKNAANTTTEWATADKSLVGLSNVDNTSDANKPVSVAQKAYVDSSNVLPYNTVTEVQLPSSYPQGTTTALTNVDKGWPDVGGTGSGFVQVVTNKSPSYAGGAVQWVSAYQKPDKPIRYRVSNSDDTWGPFQEIATTALVDARVPSVSATEFGALGDGATDDTTSIQAALNFAGSLAVPTEVTLPNRIFNVGELFVPSWVTLRGIGQATLNRVTGNNVVSLNGAVEPEVEISIAIASGSKMISTKTAHGLSVGDIIYLKSQRDSLSVDAPADWRLGYATPGSGACYYAEFLTVATVPSNTQVTVTTATVFPSYRPDQTQDSAPTSRASSTIQKVIPNKGAGVKNITFTGSPAQCVRTEWATDFVLENLIFRSTTDKPAFNINKSYSGDLRACKVYYPERTAAIIYLRNAFKIISSVGIDMENCYVENGSQCFDFTYAADYGPSMYCTLRNSRTLWAQTNGATTHGGTYSIDFEGNRFDNCISNGLSIRSRESKIIGNSVNHAYDVATTYGIRLYEGWAVDCIISNNTVSGFGFGFDVIDAPDMGEKFERIGALVSTNTFTNCNVGISCIRSASNPYRGESGLDIKNNQFTRMRASGTGINLGHHVYGASIVGNTLDGNGVGSTAIKLDLNCDHTRVDQNDISGWFGRGVDHRGFDSADLTSSSVYVWGNLFRGTMLTANRYVATSGGTWRGYGFHGDPNYFTNRQAISGSRGGNAALAALLTRLNNMGILTDSTSV